MDYLALVNQGLLLSRVGEARLSEPLTSFAGATGPVYELIQWIAQADADIQLSQTAWLFMRGSADLLLATSQSTLVPAAAQATIRLLLPAEDVRGMRSIGCYKDDLADESRVQFMDYETWYGASVGRGVQQRTGRPARFTERNGTLYFDAVTDDNYQITFDYVRQPQRMTAATSNSLIPDEHRMAIVWWALARYYCLTRDKAAEFRQKCEIELKRELNRMYAAQLPPFTTG